MLKLISSIHQCLDKDPRAIVSVQILERGLQHVGKEKRTNREFKFRVGIDNYEMGDVILDLGSDVNILPKKTWEHMGKPMLV